ncbi:MAG: carbamate kinase [Firmicutes bacterium]|nr:carbamate kinase [Bacillota bacterium]
MKKVVVALGGNAILQAGQAGTVEQQLANIDQAAGQIAAMIMAGYRVVITHGNGPQVGNILLQNEKASDLVPAMPLDVCGAQTQGQIGYLLQQSLTNILRQHGHLQPVVTVVTQVSIAADDPALKQPTKPIGPYFSAAQAQELAATQGYIMQEDKARGGWRRLVPSPTPLRIQEREAILNLLASGAVVIAAGGGGIPVVETERGLRGIEAVIDKDLASQRLAVDIGAEILLILTDVKAVAINWGSPGQEWLGEVHVAEARRYQAEGHFRAGSMGPKVEAACSFVEEGGEIAIITSLEAGSAALQGKAGTRFIL